MPIFDCLQRFIFLPAFFITDKEHIPPHMLKQFRNTNSRALLECTETNTSLFGY